jgi:hypothetical protein
MAMAQLSGRISLRDIVGNVSAQAHRLYHLGSAKLTRSNLARMNENKPYNLYEALFGKLFHHCQCLASGHVSCQLPWPVEFFYDFMIFSGFSSRNYRCRFQ